MRFACAAMAVTNSLRCRAENSLLGWFVCSLDRREYVKSVTNIMINVVPSQIFPSLATTELESCSCSSRSKSTRRRFPASARMRASLPLPFSAIKERLADVSSHYVHEQYQKVWRTIMACLHSSSKNLITCTIFSGEAWWRSSSAFWKIYCVK
jgi:hypothetical protein